MNHPDEVALQASQGQVKRKLGLIHDRLEEIGIRLIHISDVGCRIEAIR